MRLVGRVVGAIAWLPFAAIASAFLFDWWRYAGLAAAGLGVGVAIAGRLPVRAVKAMVVAIPLLGWLGGYWPRLVAPHGLDGAVVEDIPLGTSDAGLPRRPFYFSWNPRTRHLLVTHAHGDDGGSGVTLVDLAETAPRARYYPWNEEHAHNATELPAQATIAVHVSSESVPRTLLYPLAGGAPLQRTETRFAEIETSVYDARTESLHLADVKRRTLASLDPADFVAGDFSRCREWTLATGNIKQLLVDPSRAGLLYGRVDLPAAITRFDATTGDLVQAHLGVYCASIAVDGRRGELYATQTYRNSLAVLDPTTLRVLRRRVIGGWPYGVERVAPLGWIAVGSYLGRRVLFLDADTLAVRATLPACDKVRSLMFDERDSFLYFGDVCGLHRVKLPPAKS